MAFEDSAWQDMPQFYEIGCINTFSFSVSLGAYQAGHQYAFHPVISLTLLPTGGEGVAFWLSPSDWQPEL